MNKIPSADRFRRRAGFLWSGEGLTSTIKLEDAINIADFYNVSLDYLAGRTNCKNINRCR